MRIEDVPLGARIDTRNPNRDELMVQDEPDSATWVRAVVKVIDDSRTIVAEILRPGYKFRDLLPGDTIELEMAELGIEGTGIILELDACPPRAEEPGEVVTGRFVTKDVDDLVQLTLPEGETLTGTPSHPLWSVNHNTWQCMADLVAGDELLGKDGPVAILEAKHIYDIVDVVNLEVHREHVYAVTTHGVLVHNNTLAELCAKLKEVQEAAIKEADPSKQKALLDQAKKLEEQLDTVAS